MSKISKKISTYAVIAATFAGSAEIASAADVSKGQLIACRDEVHFGNHGFSDLPMAAFSVWAGGDQGGNVDWRVKWDGLKAKGTCQVGAKHNKVHDVTILKKRQKGGSSAGSDDFYYDRHVAAWRDPSGAVCHTCTPENGFPDHGKHDRAHKDHQTKLERQLQRQISNSLSQDDIDAINALADSY